MHLSPLPSRPTAVDVCTSRLRAAILAGSLAPGDRLPAERDLAQQLDVNRVTVRGALGRLTAAGLLRVRQGSGYTVREYQTSGGSDLLAPLADIAQSAGRLPEVASELLRVRRHLAMALLERLAEVQPDAEGVAAAVDQFETVVLASAPFADIVAADLAVLAALIAAADSPALSLCLNPITSVLAHLPALSRAMYRDPAENLRGWRLFVAWLRSPALTDSAVLAQVLAARDAATLAALTTPRLVQP